MKIDLLVVGKSRDREAAALCTRYLDRIERFGVPVTTTRVPEVRTGGHYTDEHVREREARSIVKALGSKGHVIALDPGGTALTSEQLAARLESWSRPLATFVIGGPIGLHESVRRRADFVWSLSALTLPHELALTVVAEQLYRGLTLLRGVPYHK